MTAPLWVYDEDGYCVCCGNGKWKHHMPECELADLLAYRALRPDCPTCHGDKVVRPFSTGNPCPDCTDGKMPLDKWVALLVRTLNESRIALSAATTIGERHRTPLNYGNHDRLVASIDAVLKMVPK